jgi:hypothetical protein
MFNADTLTFQEFKMNEPLPLSVIHEAILTFLRDRDDVVLVEAQAVNAYVSEPRMTQDVDLISTRAEALAAELQDYLHNQFHIAIRVRRIGEGRGYRLFQVQKSGNRHLTDIRSDDVLPAAQRIAQILVMAPAELIASKIISYYQRRGQPKSGTDWRDIAMLLLTFPELKQSSGAVLACLKLREVNQTILDVWQDFVSQDIQATDDDEF